MSHNVDVTDIVLRAKADGRREGMEEAARILDACGWSGVASPATLIRERIPTTETAPPPEVEVCEFERLRCPGFECYRASCGCLVGPHVVAECPNCGKPIVVKG